MRHSKRHLHFLFSCLLYVAQRDTEKRKEQRMEKTTKTFKISVFRVVVKIEICLLIFYKNCLTLLVSGRENTTFSCSRSGLAKCFGAQTTKTRKNYKNSGFSGHCRKPKNDIRCFLGWVKKWALLAVFLESIALLKTLFYTVFSKTQQLQQKMRVEKQKFYEKCGLFLNMAKMLLCRCLLHIWFVVVGCVLFVCFCAF